MAREAPIQGREEETRGLIKLKGENPLSRGKVSEKKKKSKRVNDRHLLNFDAREIRPVKGEKEKITGDLHRCIPTRKGNHPPDKKTEPGCRRADDRRGEKGRLL